MKLLDKIPYLGEDGGEETERGRVRLLGELGQGKDLEPGDFNELIKSSVRRMNEDREDKEVLLDDELREDVTREDLLDRHLVYRVKVGERRSTSGRNDGMVESTTFRVIMREQPSRAIEVNGPGKISLPFKEAIRNTYDGLFPGEIHFESILDG